MLRNLAAGNGRKGPEMLENQKNTRLLTKSSQNSLIIFTLQAQKKQFISFFFFLSKKTFKFTRFKQSTCRIDTDGVLQPTLKMMFDLLKILKICQVFCLLLSRKMMLIAQRILTCFRLKKACFHLYCHQDD